MNLYIYMFIYSGWTGSFIKGAIIAIFLYLFEKEVPKSVPFNILITVIITVVIPMALKVGGAK